MMSEAKGKCVGTLVYFGGLHSRGEPCKLIAAYGGLNMKKELITFEQWGKMKCKEIPYLPMIKKPDGKNMLETEDICKHLAILGGKMVVDEKQAALAKIANGPPMIFADPFLNVPKAMWAKYNLPSVEDWANKQIAPLFKKLAADLGSGPFFAGETPGYGEALIWNGLHNATTGPGGKKIADAVGEEDMKKLMAFHDKMIELPGIKEWFAARPSKFGMPGSHASTL
mmetsp:Transcript_1127/g.1565  ORF Transcript_1127/g.1565 Transcript_1127/m.1565 type:complete len:226 (+) Transcript_1127:27-704(+)